MLDVNQCYQMYRLTKPASVGLLYVTAQKPKWKHPTPKLSYGSQQISAETETIKWPMFIGPWGNHCCWVLLTLYTQNRFRICRLCYVTATSRDRCMPCRGTASAVADEWLPQHDTIDCRMDRRRPDTSCCWGSPTTTDHSNNTHICNNV